MFARHGLDLNETYQIRCDAEYPDECSRCRRLGLACVKSVNTNTARKTKAQLQRELEMLKASSPGRTTRDRDAVEESPDPSTLSQPQVSPSNITPTAIPAADIDCVLNQNMPFSIATPLAASNAPEPSSDIGPCASRSLDGHEVDSRKIRDCFAMYVCANSFLIMSCMELSSSTHRFFRQYSPFLPIIPTSLTPDKCFGLSQFLFWAIVFVGSRRYSRDPTLLGRLVPCINSMALQALGTRANPIETIQGLLILCVWPVPLNSMYKDITTVLSGAATHLAMQIGLHVVGSGQDFARTRLSSGYEDKLYRAQLWAHCLIISHE